MISSYKIINFDDDSIRCEEKNIELLKLNSFIFTLTCNSQLDFQSCAFSHVEFKNIISVKKLDLNATFKECFIFSTWDNDNFIDFSEAYFERNP